MSQRVLLIVALGLMAAGLLLGIGDLMAGGIASPVNSQQVPGPEGRQGGPGGGFQPRYPGIGPGAEPGEGIWRQVPLPKPSPTG